jgi:hypothetical protein
LIHLKNFYRNILLLIFCLGAFSISQADNSDGTSCTSVVRTQLQSIADEVISQLKLDTKVRVALLVDGEEPHSLAENAFVEALQKSGFAQVISTVKKEEQIIHVSILGVDIKVRELETKFSERTIRTTLEARTISGLNSETHFLGKFQRETKDTAQVFSFIQLGTFAKEEDAGVMQRLLTPFIVIGGAVVIIYIFFTVRS